MSGSTLSVMDNAPCQVAMRGGKTCPHVARGYLHDGRRACRLHLHNNPPEGHRRNTLRIRYTDEEMELIVGWANDFGLSMSDVVRRISTGMTLPPPPRQLLDSQALGLLQELLGELEKQGRNLNQLAAAANSEALGTHRLEEALAALASGQVALREELVALRKSLIEGAEP